MRGWNIKIVHIFITRYRYIKKVTKYKSENDEISRVEEPGISYASNVSGEIGEIIPFMSMDEVLHNGLSLEESRGLMFQRIYDDFHK